MSCDKWAYEPEKCDGEECCGDCDNCMLDELMDEDEEEATAIEMARDENGLRDWERKLP